MTYKWLVFDADNTLLDFKRSADIALSETLHSIGLEPEEALLDLYHRINLECWGNLEAGRITPEELKTLRFSKFLDHVGINGDPAEINAFYFEVLKRSTYRVDGALTLLEIIRPLGIPMAIATNGLAEVQRPRLAQAGIEHFFEEIIVSEEIGYFKPNPGFFHTTAERLRAQRSDRLLMIGDSLYSDIAGAQRAGWDTCWYNPYGARQELPTPPNFIINNLHQLLEILT